MAVSPVRSVMIGGNVESERVFRGLIAADLAPVAIVVPRGRLARATSDLAPGIEEAARDHDIDVVATEDINDPDTVEAIAAHDPAYLFVTGWSQLLREAALAVPTRFAVGSHPSALPQGRGRAPLPWTILEGTDKLTVSLFRMTVGADAGPILATDDVSVDERIHVGELYELVAAALARVFTSLAAELATDPKPSGTPQLGEPTYRHRRTDVDGFLDWHRSAMSLDRLVRAVGRPYPGAWGVVSGKERRIWRSAGVADDRHHTSVPGTVVEVREGTAWISTGDGLLGVHDITGPDGEDAELRRGMRFELGGGELMRRVLQLEQRVAELTEIIG